MDEVMLVSTNSDECTIEEVRTQTDTPDLRKQILDLLGNRVSDFAVMVLQEELLLMQRAYYYLDIQHDVHALTNQHEHAFQPSDRRLWSRIDRQRLQRALTQTNTQIKLLLSYLEMLYHEIVRGCNKLETFITKCDQGLVDSDMAASMHQMLQVIPQYVNDFESGLMRGVGPLELQTQLIPNTDRLAVPLRVSLFMKLPLIFNRQRSCATSNSVCLCWEVPGQEEEEHEEFEISVKSLHPTTAEPERLTISTCQAYYKEVTDLIPGRFYQFSVKRTNVINLVYGDWMDTIVLKTADISE